MSWRWIAALLFPALLAGCVTERDLQVQRDLMDMTRRLDHVERSLKAVQEETTGGVKTRLESLIRAQAEQQAGIDGLRVDMQGVQGRFDDLGRADVNLRQELTLLKDELGLQVADLGQRVAKLEPALILAPPGESADELYEKALQTIRDKQEPAAGRELMTTFLRRYPTDPRTVNAAYWIGETHYAEKDYEKAVLQFEEVAQKYGDDPKVASALYKQALAFDALKDRKSARVVMKKVIERFPLAEEAKKAKEKLKEWGN
jgi:tol-pal system protein YbgF